MPTYAYRCPVCGPFDVVLPMAARTARRCCPTCAAPGDRIFSPPAVRRTTAAYTRALSAQERSRSEPEVTTAVPPSPGPSRVTTDPRHARLPRP